MKSPITTHVLDLSLGKPAAGLVVRLEKFSGGAWLPVAEAVTDSDGRIMTFLSPDQSLSNNPYRLTFQTGEYFASTGREAFYPKVSVEFLAAEGEHYHIPLLLSPFGYTTYRGS